MNSITHRFTIWCLLDTGPFKDFLYKINKANNTICRYCDDTNDSLPSHSAKDTIKFLDKHKVNFIKPNEWLPNSPDAASCDYFFWSYLKSQVNKRNPKTLNGLKKVIRDQIKKVPQSIINIALMAWPKRLRKIYYCQDANIENLK